MALIRSKNTKPELIVRSLLHHMGYRFRVHRRDLPGTPDIVLTRHHAILFIHGCFWHFHKGCRDGKIPKTYQEWWQEKLTRNVIRDRQNLIDLRRAGWKVLIVWECEIRKNLEKVKGKITKFLA